MLHVNMLAEKGYHGNANDLIVSLNTFENETL